MTHYQRPGLLPLLAAAAGPVRGLYQATNGQGYAVAGQRVYTISANVNAATGLASGWSMAQIGTLAAAVTTPVSMIDNRTTLFLVDGSSQGYSVNLASGAFAPIVDPTGTFNGADKVDYLDTFFLFNIPGTNQFGATHSNSLVFDPLYVAGKTDYPDNLTTLMVNRHELLLIGQYKTEIWYDAGLANFPFAELPGAFHEHGSVAKYSVASADISVFWLSNSLQGGGRVYMARGYECKRISNYALEYAIRKMKYATGINDAIGYCYTQDGHEFYNLHFPAGDQTWVFDTTTGDWHQQAWTDPATGLLHRHRGNCYCNMYNTALVGDSSSGTIYQMNLDTYTDTLTPGASSGPITFIRGFPHVLTTEMNLGAPGLDREVASQGKQLKFNSMFLDLECGMGPLDASGAPASVRLSYSRDRGRTFSGAPMQTAGAPGQFLTHPTWRALGMSRDMVFEIEHSIAGPAALNGLWYDAEALEV